MTKFSKINEHISKYLLDFVIKHYQDNDIFKEFYKTDAMPHKIYEYFKRILIK